MALLLLGAAPGRARAQGLVTIARRTLAAALDSTLPRVRFDRWLAGLGGNQPLPVRWEVNDCGEGGDGREAPTCVEATLDLAGDSTAHVSLVVADVAGKRVAPAVWDLSIGAGGSFTGFGSLHAWSAYVRMHHRQH